ncbi:Uncharacterized protein HA466_0080300 [Hirschfeldia incana]|nr:Uncharacterized protein HA466_0080300 [Hirschfeldia incana]
MTGADWTQEAMSDDSLVAEALICLHHAEPPPPPPVKSGGSDLKLKWNVRQRRSKAATAPLRKKGDHTRSSPTTPLSWSGATSLSGGGGGAPAAVDGVEESSGVKVSEAVRSKISRTSVTTTTPLKRSRKKKTLAELREEESLLLKEKKSLKNELASMRDMLKQQRARNESLKKMQQDAESLKKDDSSSFLLPDLNIPLDNNNPMEPA